MARKSRMEIVDIVYIVDNARSFDVERSFGSGAVSLQMVSTAILRMLRGTLYLPSDVARCHEKVMMYRISTTYSSGKEIALTSAIQPRSMIKPHLEYGHAVGFSQPSHTTSCRRTVIMYSGE